MRIGPQKGPHPDWVILPETLTDMTRQPTPSAPSVHQPVIASCQAPAVGRVAWDSLYRVGGGGATIT
jgi:hypothetical protein